MVNEGKHSRYFSADEVLGGDLFWDTRFAVFCLKQMFDVKRDLASIWNSCGMLLFCLQLRKTANADVNRPTEKTISVSDILEANV